MDFKALKLEQLLFEEAVSRASLPNRTTTTNKTQLISESFQKLAPTSENIRRAKRFVFDKWQQRAKEYGRDQLPFDLSGACKFASLFAKGVFGGQLKGNKLHQFLELEGQIIDLTAGSKDVASMLNPYHHDKVFWRNAEHVQSLDSCSVRVSDWVNEFLDEVQNTESVVDEKPLVEDLDLKQKLLLLRKSSEGEPQSFAKEMKNLGFPLIGAGETRMVFALNDQVVLKLSKSLWKHIQNQREVFFHDCLQTNGHLRWFAKVVDYDREKFFWLMTERVKPLGPHEVAKHTARLLGPSAVTLLKEKGYEPTNPASLLLLFGEGDKTLKRLMQLSEWFRGFSDAVSQCKIPIDDLPAGNFGLRTKNSYDSEGDLVVLDYGD